MLGTDGVSACPGPLYQLHQKSAEQVPGRTACACAMLSVWQRQSFAHCRLHRHLRPEVMLPAAAAAAAVASALAVLIWEKTLPAITVLFCLL